MSRVLTDADLDNYIPVAERIAKFWILHDEGSIQTLMEFPDSKTVRAICHVKRDASGPVCATGHAEEIREGEINTFSAVENAETSAVGRALAMLGIATQRGVASREEMQKVKRLQEAQVAPIPPVGPPPPAELHDPPSNGGTQHDPQLDDKRAALATKIMELPPEMRNAVRLRLVALGVTNPKSPQEALAVLDAEKVQYLESWLDSLKEDSNAPSA